MYRSENNNRPLIMVVVFLGIIFIASIGIFGSDFDLGNDISSPDCLTLSSGNTAMWWPIGSTDTTESNGIKYAIGNPACTTISSYFGNRKAPTAGASSVHKAIDIGCAVNNNLIAVLDGTVEYSGASSGYGNIIKVNHGNGIVTQYGHIYTNGLLVKTGDTVKQGQVIGLVGNAGISTGAHLDFKVYLNGKEVNPLDYISADDPRPTSSGAITKNTCGSSSGGIGSSVTGNDRAQTVCLTMKNWTFEFSQVNSNISIQKKLSDEAIAGIMANMNRETEQDPFSTTIKNSDGCLGIVQWCDRKSALKNYLGSNINSLEGQLSFIYYEMTSTSEKKVVPELMKDYTVDQMASKFCTIYERAGSGCTNGKNEKFTKVWYPYVKNGCSD